MGEQEGPERTETVAVVGPVIEKTSRFSREVVATMISLATAAFGVVAALAWNSAITALFERYYHQVGQTVPPASQVSAFFVYAFVVTLIGVVVIVLLGRLAGRINAQPVEFKYPVAPKNPSS
jgi:diacylglycerol kinase